MSGPGGMAFPTILASTVHDMKNSIGMLMRALDSVIDCLPEEARRSNKSISVMQYEAARVNNAMIQLLSLYKLDHNQLPINIGYHNLLDFFDELHARHAELFQYHRIDWQIDCEPELDWYMDHELMLSAFGNIITNTIRYSKSLIIAAARATTEGLIIEIDDDGPGYPPLMIEKQQDYLLGVNYSTGSTGLGLFFCAQIAALHQRNEQQGRISLGNGKRLCGGQFQMILP